MYSVKQSDDDKRSNKSYYYTFRKSGKNPITIPKHEPIKKVYVEMVRDIVEEEMLHENN